jgi:phosphoglycolate phosphatase
MLSLRKTKAVIFDFDGTLAVLNIDFSTMKDQVLALIRQFGVDEGSVKEKYLLEMIEEVCEILTEKHEPDGDEFYGQAHWILHRTEMEAARKGSLIPGARETLKVLREKKIKVGIVTRNCEEAVREVFPDIESHCDVFVSRDSVRNVKPHPDHLRSVMGTLGIGGEESVMVGDHTLDIQAGNRVGMKTIGVLTGRVRREEFEKAGADLILVKASEIIGLLEA